MTTWIATPITTVDFVPEPRRLAGRKAVAIITAAEQTSVAWHLQAPQEQPDILVFKAGQPVLIAGFQRVVIADIETGQDLVRVIEALSTEDPRCRTCDQRSAEFGWYQIVRDAPALVVFMRLCNDCAGSAGVFPSGVLSYAR